MCNPFGAEAKAFKDIIVISNIESPLVDLP